VGHKPGQAIAGASYLTSATYARIRAHYDTTLVARGWRFQSETPVRAGGRDLGGKTAAYCKGGMEADLQYAGERANYGWTYSLDVVWGNLAHTCQ
jgi:hypothetical protein